MKIYIIQKQDNDNQPEQPIHWGVSCLSVSNNSTDNTLKGLKLWEDGHRVSSSVLGDIVINQKVIFVFTSAGEWLKGNQEDFNQALKDKTLKNLFKQLHKQQVNVFPKKYCLKKISRLSNQIEDFESGAFNE